MIGKTTASQVGAPNIVIHVMVISPLREAHNAPLIKNLCLLQEAEPLILHASIIDHGYVSCQIKINLI